MKVAILGAGVSGLACAITLKKYGIKPHIFEKKSTVGEPLAFGSILFNMCNQGIANPFTYLKRYGIDLKYSSRLKVISMKCESVQKDFYTQLGFTAIRGESPDSLENQLNRQLDLPIQFNTFITLDLFNQIKKEYDYVIVAMGGKSIAESMGVWKTNFQAANRIATVFGNFKMGNVELWFNTRYANNAFAYLIPVTESMAKLCLICSDTKLSDLDAKWNIFTTEEKIHYDITEIRDMEHYTSSGYTKTLKQDNVFLIGNSAGLVDSLIGNGSFKAIQSGIFAAESIVKGHDYNKMMSGITKELKIYNDLRTVIREYENKDFARLIKCLHAPGIYQFIYKNSEFFIADFDKTAKLLKFLTSKNRPNVNALRE